MSPWMSPYRPGNSFSNLASVLAVGLADVPGFTTGLVTGFDPVGFAVASVFFAATGFAVTFAGAHKSNKSGPFAKINLNVFTS